MSNEENIPSEDTTQTDDTEPKEPSPQGALASLPVRIDFHVGEVSVPASKLGELCEGYCFPKLEGSGFPLARALCGGKAFAEGELVDIDGTLGFRITRLLD